MRLAVVAAMLATFCTLLIGSIAAVERYIPSCEEDQVLIGTGHFVAGRWDEYVCGPSVDDYAGQEDR